MQMKIRKAKEEDAKEVEKFVEKSILSSDCYSSDQKSAWINDSARNIDEKIKRKDRTSFVVLMDGKPAGYASQAGNYVHALYVDIRFMRRGIGRKMLKRMERNAASAGFSTMKAKASLDAVPFYEKMGYKKLGETTYETGDVKIPLILMRKRLETTTNKSKARDKNQ